MPKSLDDVISAVSDLSAPSTTKFDPLRSWLGSQLELDADDVYAVFVSKPANLKVRLDQSGGAARPVGAIVVKGAAASADFERTVDTARRLVGDEDYPAALLFIATDASGAWVAKHILAAGRPDLVDALRRVFPKATFEPVVPSATSTQAAPATVTDLAEALFVSPEWLTEILELIEDRKALIFYGPPGTGKTYIARSIARYLQRDAKLRTLVQFHPSFGYEEFFEGYRPTPSAGGLQLTKQPGPLRSLAREAVRRPEEKAVLTMDEVNRGNLPRVFGELYFLIEYRQEKVSLMYSPDEEFSLPENLYFLGTMNTADRSVAVLDQALRRRFHFVGLFPGESPVDGMLRAFLQKHRPELVWLADLLDRANAQLERHVRIGPSHLMRRGIDEPTARRVWKYAVLPSIAEQYFGREDELASLDFDVLKAQVTTST